MSVDRQENNEGKHPEFERAEGLYRRTISHQLREELYLIAGYAEQITSGVADPKAHAQLIRNAADELTRKIDELTRTASVNRLAETTFGPVFDLSEKKPTT